IRSEPGLSTVINGAWRAMTPSSPSAPLAMMNSTSPSKRLCSTLTTRSAYFMSGRRGLLHLFTLCARLFDGANHVESLLREVIVLALQDLGEALGNEVGLRQEPLDLPRARYCQLVVLRQLFHAQDRDDVLQVLVALHRFLDALGGVVVRLPHNRGLDEATRRPERVDRGIDPDLDQRPLQSHRGAQVRENGLYGGVGVVVRRHVHSL